MSQLPSLYLGPDGWSNNPENATVKVESLIEQKIRVVNTTSILEGGAWQVKSTPQSYHFTVSSLMLDDLELIQFSSIRAIDKEMLELLPSAPYWDTQGIKLDKKQLIGIGRTFLMTKNDAKIFAERVKKMGGEVVRGDPPELAEVNIKLEKLLLRIADLEAALKEDYIFLSQLSQGDLSQKVVYTDRSKRFREEINDISDDLEKASSIVETFPEVIEKIHDLNQQLNSLLFRKNRVDRIVIRIESKTTTSIDMNLVITDLALLIQDKYSVRKDGASLVIELDQGKIVIGEEVSIDLT